jgi:hypothetical protein
MTRQAWDPNPFVDQARKMKEKMQYAEFGIPLGKGRWNKEAGRRFFSGVNFRLPRVTSTDRNQRFLTSTFRV